MVAFKALQIEPRAFLRFISCVCGLFLWSCNAFWGKGPPEDTKPASIQIHILANSSMLGENAVEGLLKNHFNSETLELFFHTPPPHSSLLGELRSASSSPLLRFFKSQTLRYHIILGLDQVQFTLAQSEGLVSNKELLNTGPLSLIADTQVLPEEQWPKSWNELAEHFSKKVLIQDPRLSSVGFAWLSASHELKLIDPKIQRSLVRQTFPSWSSSYRAFLAGHAPLVWSYLSSEAFHRCQEGSSRYRAIPLKEGYPLQQEWAVSLKTSEEISPYVQSIFDYLRSEDFQSQIPTLNWMFPARSSTPLPKCYEALNSTTTHHFGQELNQASYQKLLDLWSLQ